MLTYRFDTFAEAYKDSLTDLLTFPEYETRPRGMTIKENCDVALVIDNPLSCLYENTVRSSQLKYIAAELLWYFMGRNDVGYISKFAKFWESIQNDDGTVNSSYGHLLFANPNEHGFMQYEWAVNSLLKDKDSRQAVLHFNLPSHQRDGNKDFVCTMYGIFQIRENKLNFTVSMRSNDVILGLPTDIAFFVTLQSQMLFHLVTHGGEEFRELELGTYTHIANSFHLYERHFDLVDRMIREDFVPHQIPKVREELVSVKGKPSPLFSRLFSTQNDPNEKVGDELMHWIKNKLNS
jgi:thymidylate synthase